MQLQFIGCGDAFGSGGRFNTCFHLVGRNINALIDCGATSLVSMNKLAISRNDIDTILFTHFHADHIGGLPFFILEANYVLKRRAPLMLAGPPGLKSHYAAIMENAFPGTQTMEWSFPLAFREFEIGERNDVGHMQIIPLRVLHDERAGPCLGLRIEAEGKVIAYSGDSQWTDSLIEVGRNTDLFICEAYTRDKPIATHMALSLLERHLDQIRPKRLILTHMSNDMLARRGEIKYETAEDGMVVEI
jgi:ribonuclease BN (tRNA processing enzyme)